MIWILKWKFMLQNSWQWPNSTQRHLEYNLNIKRMHQLCRVFSCGTWAFPRGRLHKPSLFHLKNRSCIVVKLFHGNGIFCWKKPISNTQPLVFTADNITAINKMMTKFFCFFFNDDSFYVYLKGGLNYIWKTHSNIYKCKIIYYKCKKKYMCKRMDWF